MAVGTDIGNLYSNGVSIPPQNYVADFNGVGVDLQETLEHVTAVVSLGLVEGSDTTVTIKLQESSDDSTYTDISGATTSALSSDRSSVVQTFGGRSARYVRAVATFAGSSNDADISVVLIAPKKSW